VGKTHDTDTGRNPAVSARESVDAFISQLHQPSHNRSLATASGGASGGGTPFHQMSTTLAKSNLFPELHPIAQANPTDDILRPTRFMIAPA